jgi:hypothetical protein
VQRSLVVCRKFCGSSIAYLSNGTPPLSYRATNDDRPHDPHIPVKAAYLRYPLGARRADDPPKTVPVPRISRLMTTHRMHGPTPLAQRILAPMPQAPELRLVVTTSHRPQRGRCATSPRWAAVRPQRLPSAPLGVGD